MARMGREEINERIEVRGKGQVTQYGREERDARG